MDLLTRLGGRKFIMAMIVIGIGVFMEFNGHPLSTTMAGFLVAIIGSFHVTNHLSTQAYLKNKPQGSDGVHKKLDDLQTKLVQSTDPERTAALQQLLVDINNGVKQTQIMSAQIGQTLINLGNKR